MRNQKTKLSFLFILSLFVVNTFAQKILTDYDSIVIPGPKFFTEVYKLDDSRLKQIKIVTRAPESVTGKQKNFWGNLAGGLFTLTTGISTSSSDEDIWVTEDRLEAGNDGYSWGIHLFFPGEFSKVRNRVENDDGSKSTETEKSVSVNWDNGANGLIMENGDTIGRFSLSTDFQSDGEGRRWIQRIEDESGWVREKLKKSEPGGMYDDYVVFGNLRGKNFDVITCGNLHKSVIFIDDKVVAVFQGPPVVSILGKKNKITPYLLLDKSFEDSGKIDVFRLALLNRLIDKRVSVENFSL
jgi:hypothetical protein